MLLWKARAAMGVWRGRMYILYNIVSFTFLSGNYRTKNGLKKTSLGDISQIKINKCHLYSSLGAKFYKKKSNGLG